MQLKILIGIICLILCSATYSAKKAFLKNKENTSLRSVSKQEPNPYPTLDPSSMYAWVLPGALKLFKEVGNRVFDAKDPMALRRCLDDIENNSDLGPTPYKQLWDKLATINKEFFSKQQMEAQSKSGAVSPDKLAALTSFSNWGSVLGEEYKALMGGSQNKMIIQDCNQNFDKTRGNVYDLMNILQKPDYFGMKFEGGKNQQFIDSQYSIYRQTIAPGSFKRLNDASDQLLSMYNKQTAAIAAGKRGIPKAPGPYDQKALKDNRKMVNVSLILNIFYLKIFNFLNNFIYIIIFLITQRKNFNFKSKMIY